MTKGKKWPEPDMGVPAAKADPAYNVAVDKQINALLMKGPLKMPMTDKQIKDIIRLMEPGYKFTKRMEQDLAYILKHEVSHMVTQNEHRTKAINEHVAENQKLRNTVEDLQRQVDELQSQNRYLTTKQDTENQTITKLGAQVQVLKSLITEALGNSTW